LHRRLPLCAGWTSRYSTISTDVDSQVFINNIDVDAAAKRDN